MIEYRCNQGMEKLKVSGSVSELLTDTCTLIHDIYSNLSGDAAEVFKSGFLDNIEVAFMTTEEIEAKTNEKVKEQENCLDELIECLERLVKKIDGEEDSKDGSESDEA